MKIILASNNSGKLAELHAMFAPLGFELIAQGQLGKLGYPLVEKFHHVVSTV